MTRPGAEPAAHASPADDVLGPVSQLLGELAGLAVVPGRPRGRGDAVALAVATRARALSLPDPPAYLARLSTDADERQALLEEVLVGETQFWRNAPQMHALRHEVLPRLLRVAQNRGRRLRVWSAGCSTGEEPYSIAMMLAELLAGRPGWSIEVVGTDVSRRALAAARDGVYGPRSVAGLAPERRTRWLTELPGGRFRVRDDLRDLVAFREHNLVRDPVPWPGDVHLVVCRNVTIYFDRATTRRVIDALGSALAPDGLLMLGHSETLWKLADGFTLLRVGDAYVYRRGGPGPRAGARNRPRPRAEAARPEPPRPEPPRPEPPRPEPPRPEAPRPEAQRSAAAVPPSNGRPRSVHDLLEAAEHAQRRGDYAGAGELAARAAAQAPLEPRAHYLHGLALVSENRLAEAATELRRAVFIDPRAGFAHFLLASTLGRLGDPAGAAAEYRAAADTLGRRSGERSAGELDGRPVSELVELCRVLARETSG